MGALKRILSFFLTVIVTLNSICLAVDEVAFNGAFVIKTKAISENELTFELNFDRTAYSVVDCNESAEGEIIIPETHNSLPVIRIGREAFKDCTKITSVTIGSRITTIGDYAFENCSSLESVVFPDTVTYSKSTTKIVNDCQNIDDWEMYNSTICKADYEDFILGSQSIHFSSGQITCTKDTYDMLNNNLVLNLRINSISNGARLYMQVCNTKNKSVFSTYEIMRGSITTPIGSWREITVPYTGFSSGNLDKLDYTKIDQIKFYVSGGEVDWNLQYIGEKPIVADKGIVSFTFDDGYKSQYTGLEILGQKGIKGTLFYIPEANTNGSADYLKIDDLKKLVELYQTDVEVHGVSSYNDKTNEELIEHWESTQKLFRENGLSEGRHMAYPNGMHEDRVVNLAKNYFDSCRTIQYYIPAETYLPADKYRIRAISSIGANCNNVDYIKNKIDRAVKANSWLILVFHRIEDGNTSMYCSEGELAAIADYALVADVEIKTIAEVMESTESVGDSIGSISVGDYAFYSCENLKNVTIPESVQNIGEKAFGYYEGRTGICEKTEDMVINVNKNSVAHIYSEDNGLIFDIICDEHIMSDWIVDTASTCTEKGLKHKECTFCGDKTDITVIPSLGHSYGDWVVVKEPTCIEEGEQSQTCATCGDIKTQTIPLTGHSYSTEWTIDVAPTCTKNGSKSRHCIVCDAKFDITSIEATGHTEVKDPAVAPTCTKAGKKAGSHCSVCNAVIKAQTTVAATGHELSDWIVDKEATVYKSGSKQKECTECGKVLKTETIPQLKCAKPVLKEVYNANSYAKVTWGAVEGADLYRVYRMISGGEYEYIGSTAHNYFNDKGAGAGKTCRYKIRAKNEAGYSEYSASLAIKHIDEPTLKSIENSAYGVLIRWDKVTGAQKYSVYRKVSGGEYEYIGATSNTYYTDKTASSGKKYYYAIRGKREDSVSSQSASLSKYYLVDPTLKTPTSTTSGIKLSWSKVTGAEGYIIYRKTGSGSYSKLATVEGVSTLNYTDKSAQKGKTYTYKVKAYKSKTYSAYSNAKKIKDRY